MLVAGRLLLAISLGPLVREAASRVGIALQFEELDLDILDGRLEVWRLDARVRQESGEPVPLLTAQTLVLDLDTTKLLKGRIVVRRFDLAGVQVDLSRGKDGNWNLDPLLASLSAGKTDESAPQPSVVKQPGPISLDSPLEIIAAHIQALTIRLHDEQQDPPTDVSLTLTLTAADIGSEEEDAELDLVATSPQVLDLFRVQGSGRSGGTSADAKLSVELSSLRLEPVADLLALLGIEPRAKRIDGGLSLDLEVTAANELGDRLKVSMGLSKARLSHDGQEALGLDSVAIKIAELGATSLHVEELSLDGLRGRATRLPGGDMSFGGLVWHGPPQSNAVDKPPVRQEATPDDKATNAVDTGPAERVSPFQWNLEKVAVSRGQLTYSDQALEPELDISAVLDELQLGPLSSRSNAPPAQLRLKGSSPQLLKSADISGTVQVFESVPEMEVAVTAEGIDPRGIAPYLAMIGIEPTFVSGNLKVASFSLGGTGNGGTEIKLSKLDLDDGQAELGTIESISVRLAPGMAPDIALEGARLEVLREKTDTVALLGLRLGASPTPPKTVGRDSSKVVEPSPEPGAPSSFSLPTLNLPTVAVSIDHVLLRDELSDSPPFSLGPLTAKLALTDRVEKEARAYAIDLQGQTQLASELNAKLRLSQAGSGSLELAGSARASELELEPLRTWLDLVGVEPLPTKSSFEGKFSLSVAAINGEPTLDLQAGPLHFSQDSATPDNEWLGLEQLTVEQLSLAGPLRARRVSLKSPSFSIQRDSSGGWIALGVRLPPPVPATAPGAQELIAASKEPATKTAPANSEETAPETSPQPATSMFQLSQLELKGARARFEDRSLAKPHTIEVGVDLDLKDLAPGVGSKASQLDGKLSLDDLSLSAKGELQLDPNDWRAKLAFGGDQLSGAAVAPYLPPGIDIDLKSGHAKGELEARYARNTEGGELLSLQLNELMLGEIGAKRPLVSLTSLQADIPRLDVAANVFNIEKIALAGAALDVVRTADGGVSLLGVHIAPAPQGSKTPKAESPETGPGTSETVVTKVERGGHLRLAHLDLELAELRVTNETHPDSPPSISHAKLALRDPYEITIAPDRDDLDLSEVAFDLTAGVSPGIKSFQLGAELTPFVDCPQLDAKIAITGISGDGLLALAPELGDRLDLSGLTDGTFDASLESELAWRRRGPFDFKLKNGFGADVLLENVALRQQPKGDIALGVDVVELEIRRFVPLSGLLEITRLEVDTPRAHIRKTKEGLQLAGVTLLAPADSPDGPKQPTQVPNEAPVEAKQSTASKDPKTKPSETEEDLASQTPTDDQTPVEGETSAPANPPETRIDSVVINGIDAVFEDATTSPAIVLPLDSLAVEVRGLSTQALIEPIPIRFSASLGGGKVSLPKKQADGSFVAGIASGAIGVISGKKEEVVYEDRPFFDEASLSGLLTLAPSPKGWLRMSMSGFELLGIRGIAREGGAEIGSGTLDFNAQVRLEGDKPGTIKSLSVFSDLSLSEPAGGPISRYLKLPVGLDTVLFVLKNNQGEHRIPLNFEIGENGKISMSNVAAKASAALLGMITEALASAPARAAGEVTDMVGLGGIFSGDGGKSKYAGLTSTIDFEAGAVRIGPAAAESLDEIIKAMEEDPLLEIRATHHFGTADLERAERLVSPNSDEAMTLLRSLRLNRDELARRNAELTSLARSQLLLGEREAFDQTRAELVSVNQALGLTENGIDLVADFLRSGSTRTRKRRVRQASLAMARARINALARILYSKGLTYARVDLRPPRMEAPKTEEGEDPHGRIVVITRGGTPPPGFFGRILGWFKF